MKLAVVDIGSNAIRCQISHVFTYHDAPVFKRIEYIRYPMKLGEEVFATGYISAAKETKFIKFLHALKLLMEVHEVEHSLICATSAMRMAKNAPAVIKRVYELLDLPIQVIDGIAEAEYINKVMHGLLDDKNYLHIDVGGGSTEFNVYVNHQKVASQSFELGSIRQLQNEGKTELWETMKQWVKENARQNHVSRAIGTGGNINKIYELAGKTNGKPIFKKQIEEIVARLESLTVEERMTEMMLNPDRADVIIPAGRIYLAAMKWAKVESMLVPALGLKDGMLQALYETHRPVATPALTN